MRYHGFTIHIEQVRDADSPDTWDCGEVFLTGKHRQFHVKKDGFMLADLASQTRLKEVEKSHYMFPLIAYIHSGVALSLQRGYPFNCPWDSGQVGWVFVAKGKGKTAITREIAEKQAESLVETWNQYLSGDVWGFVIEDEDGDHIDSCWGFYGQEYALESAKEAVDGLVRQLPLFKDEVEEMA